MIVRIPLPARFSFDAIVRSHGWYDLPPFAYDEARGILSTTAVSARGAPALLRFCLNNRGLEARSDALDRKTLASIAARGFGPCAAEGLLRILGRHDYLAVDSWIRKKFRSLHRGPARATDGAIARRYARYGRYKGLALWLEMTGDWHEPVTPSLRS